MRFIRTAQETSMPLKEIRLPQDLMAIAELAIDSFQYPENPSWNLQEDEATVTVDTMARLRRMWPLIRPLMVFSPSLQDILRGYFWVDDDGKPVGSAIVQRMGSSATWVIGNVAVVPSYRRRGIGRALVQACLELIRSHGGKIAWLEVVKGNLPAYEMYLQLGFTPYSGDVVLERNPPYPQERISLPAGLRSEILAPFDWQARHDLDLRIVPEQVQAFEPVDPGHYRQLFAMRLLRPIIMRAQGVHQQQVLVRDSETALPVATYGSRIPTRGKGLIVLQARVDPGRAALAGPVVRSLLAELARRGVNLRSEWIIPNWMPQMIAAAEQCGFVREYESIRMGQSLA